VSTQTKQPGARRRAIIAAASGFALLLGGATYALWTSSDTLQGGKIQSGDMKIEADKAYGGDKAYTAWDVTANRSDETTPIVMGSSIMGHGIDLNATDPEKVWKISPMDTAALVFKFKATLVGDNLLADVVVDPSTLVQPASNNNGAIHYSYAVLDEAGATIRESPMPSDGTHLATIASNDSDKGSGSADAVDAVVGADHTATFFLVIMPTFDQTALTDVKAADSYVNSLADMSGNIKVSLTQVRAGGQFTAPSH
jgi:alternate signal-mediated exported protein